MSLLVSFVKCLHQRPMFRLGLPSIVDSARQCQEFLTNRGDGLVSTCIRNFQDFPQFKFYVVLIRLLLFLTLFSIFCVLVQDEDFRVRFDANVLWECRSDHTGHHGNAENAQIKVFGIFFAPQSICSGFRAIFWIKVNFYPKATRTAWEYRKGHTYHSRGESARIKKLLRSPICLSELFFKFWKSWTYYFLLSSSVWKICLGICCLIRQSGSFFQYQWGVFFLVFERAAFWK